MGSLTELAAKAGYALLGPPRHGSSAAVYKARCLSSNQLVALKLLHHGHNDNRLHKEIENLSLLNHRYIARLIDTGFIGDSHYLAMQWIEGCTFNEWLEFSAKGRTEGTTSVKELALVEPLLSALHHAHALHVVHGDISPSNIVINLRNEATLIDFGIGRVMGNATVTAVNKLEGTPRYLAPELIKGEPPTPLSDQYALALVIYELFTGHWPFNSGVSNAANALHHQLYSTPTPISERRPDFGPWLDPIFDTALSKTPAQRYNTVHEFHTVLLSACRMTINKPALSIGDARNRTINGDSKRDRKSVTDAALKKNNRASLLGQDSSIRDAIAIRIGFTAGKFVIFPAVAICILGLTTISKSEKLQTKHTNLTETTVSTFAKNQTCNLYPNESFDKPLGQNFFQDKENPSLATLVEPTFDGSASKALQLGNADAYGVYGVIVDVMPDESYSFSARLWFEGYVHRMELKVLWLDANWQTIEGADSSLSVDNKQDGRHTLNRATAPTDARYAVPSVFKDASIGVVVTDDILFLPLDGSCNF